MKTETAQNTAASSQAGAARIAVWIGLDWADQQHCVSVLPPGAELPSSRFLEHKPETLDLFFLKLRQEHPDADLAVCVEQSRGAVINALSKHPFLRIYPVNPRSLSDYRRSLCPSGAKSDPRDSDLLCDFGAKHHDRLRELKLEDAATRQLRLDTETRRGFVDERTACVNQLIATLKSYYPLVLELLDSFDTPMAREFLKRWPNLARLKAAKPGVLRAFFYKHGSRSEERIEERLESIKKASALTEDPVVISNLELKAQCLAAQITALQKSIAAYDQRIAEVYSRHPCAKVFASLPGAGPVIGARLAAAFGAERENCQSADEFQKRSGVAPVTRQSGKSRVVLFRRARPRFIHQTMVEFAKSSLAKCRWAALLYQDQVKKGKTPFAAIRAVAFKWNRILFRCWQKGEAYDEAKYLQSLKAKGVKLYQSLYEALPETAQPNAEVV